MLIRVESMSPPHGRLRWSVLLAHLIASVLLFPQRLPSQSRDAAALADTILQLDRAWGQAYVHGDSLFVQRMLAPDWVGWFDDHEASRESELSDFRTGSNRLLEDVVDRANVRFFGNTAVVQARERNRVPDASGSHWESRHITDVFVRRGTRWVVVASHDSRIPDEKP